MSEYACPLPGPVSAEEQAVIQRLIAARRIAIVGLSADPEKPSHDVAVYLRGAGKEVLPVNPRHPRIMGLPSYASLRDVPGPIDVVDVFRPAGACPDVVREAIAAGAKGVWLQSGIQSPEARQLAAQAGIDFVENRCLMVEHRRRRQSPDAPPGGPGPDLIFTCSGAADVAEIGHQAARQLSAAGTASMFCLAGIGGRVPAHLQKTRQARRILVIDGCKVSCARRTLELAGFTPFVAVRVTDLGLEKGDSPPTPERVQHVAEHAARLLQA